jgi:hypothetical protein
MIINDTCSYRSEGSEDRAWIDKSMGTFLKYAVIAAAAICFLACYFFIPDSSIEYGPNFLIENSNDSPLYIKSISSQEGNMKGIPEPYYTNHTWPYHSAYGMELAVGKGFVKPYDLGEFDCSEMASFIQWRLKNYGFDAKICVSHNFQGIGGHAWVAVDIPSNNSAPKRYYIEPTASATGGFNYMIIRPSSGYAKVYGNYDSIYNSIYDLAKKEPLSKYDWWTELNFTEMSNRK